MATGRRSPRLADKAQQTADTLLETAERCYRLARQITDRRRLALLKVAEDANAGRRVTQPDAWIGQPPSFQARREFWKGARAEGGPHFVGRRSRAAAGERVARRCLKCHHHRSSCPERLWSLPQDHHAPHCSPPALRCARGSGGTLPCFPQAVRRRLPVRALCG